MYMLQTENMTARAESGGIAAVDSGMKDIDQRGTECLGSASFISPTRLGSKAPGPLYYTCGLVFSPLFTFQSPQHLSFTRLSLHNTCQDRPSLAPDPASQKLNPLLPCVRSGSIIFKTTWPFITAWIGIPR